MNETKYGYIEPKQTDAHLVFGSDNFTDPILMPDGHGWGVFLPIDELQRKNGLDTYACTCFGTLNILETISRHKYGTSYDFSDRYTAIGANIEWGVGGSPLAVIDTIRKENGVIPEGNLPFDETVTTPEQFYSPKPLTDYLLDIGRKWLKTHTVKYEFVPPNVQDMKDALQYSPLGVAVWAWTQQLDVSGDLYIRPKGGKDVHFTMLYDYVDGEYWMVFDSYDNTHKKLAWDFGFNTVIRYAILDRVPDASWYARAIASLVAILTQLGLVRAPQSVVQQVIEATVQEIKDNTPNTPVVIPEPKYSWDTPDNARHSIRVICDEVGLTYGEKNLICAVIQAESGFLQFATNENTDGTTDYGICQLNSKWYIEKMKLATKEQALNDPEFCVRLMIKRYQAGFLSDWSAFKNKSYAKFL